MMCLKVIYKALPGVLGNRGNRAFISGGQRNKGQILRGTGEQRHYWGTGNIRKQIFEFWGTGDQANLFQGNKGTGTPPWEGLIYTGLIKTEIGNWNSDGYFHRACVICEKSWWKVPEKSG